jgi:hypothetical protein
MLTLIDSMVSATIPQSESEPIASDAATALIRREEATGAAWPSKPAARGDRVMAENPLSRRITGCSGFTNSQAKFGRTAREDRGMAAKAAIIPAISKA